MDDEDRLNHGKDGDEDEEREGGMVDGGAGVEYQNDSVILRKQQQKLIFNFHILNVDFYF